MKCLAPLIAAVQLIGMAGCTPKMYDPQWATAPYPQQFHTTNTIDVKVLRRDTKIELVNGTDQSYQDVDIWINQRFVHHIASIPALEATRLSLWDFHDELGDTFNAGGFFRTHEATPVRLVEIQSQPDQSMVGLISIRSEPVKLKSDQQRRR